MSITELTSAFTDTYVTKEQALEKRMGEQTTSGTIVRVGDSVRITPYGKMIIRFYNWIADIFRIKKNNLSM